MSEAINIAGMCGDGTLPTTGGLMDQSAWFVSLWQQLRSEEARIDSERSERLSRGI
jgi:hypothetical protein